MGITAAALALRETMRNRAQGGEDSDEVGALDPHPPKPTRRKRTPKGLRRVTIAQLDLAIETLRRAQPSEFEVAIHETRKAIKRVRTLERLLREAAPRSRRERRKDLLRDAAGALSGARDAQVALGTLESLLRRHPRRLSGHPGVSKLHAALLAEHNAAERAVEQSGARERSLRQLNAVRKQLIKERRVRGRRQETRVANAGLIRIYAAGRCAMRHARKRGGVAEMHEWRKRAKDLRYATEALGQSPAFTVDSGAANGAPASKRTSVSKRERRTRKRLLQIARAADTLGEALGEERDLALLAQRLEAEDEIFRGDKRGRQELRRAIERRRTRLRKRAFKTGKALYARKPKRFKQQLAC